MNAPADRFAQNCAETSLNQMRGLAETAPPSVREHAQTSAAASFGPLPKLPPQDCADAATAPLQPVSAGSGASTLSKLEFPFLVSVLLRVSSFGGETTPYGGGGERRRRVLPRPPPGVSRARPAHAPTSRSDDGGPVPPSTRPPSSSTRAANQKRRPPMADLTLATHRREAIPDLPPAVRANRAMLALDLGTASPSTGNCRSSRSSSWRAACRKVSCRGFSRRQKRLSRARKWIYSGEARAAQPRTKPSFRWRGPLEKERR